MSEVVEGLCALHEKSSLGAQLLPFRVRWTNDLLDSNGNFMPHMLKEALDQTLPWANPQVRGGGMKLSGLRDTELRDSSTLCSTRAAPSSIPHTCAQ